MNQQRWQQLKPLFQGALERPAAHRDEWLREECSDPELRAEAKALIDAHESAGDFLEVPAAVDDELAESPPLAPGRHVGPYIVKGELGRGGMGIVYLAEDVRLSRTVALKALPASLAGDERRRERLRREARAAAALTHQGIAVVYALEEIDGDLFIASEHLKGQSLKAELANGPLGAPRAIETGIEIVRALCAAHEAGIIHRDLKPENILRTDEGRIKLLDFGIAQFADRTLTQLTMAGAVIGTPAYMAPEQLQGREVDFRADIYAVGVLLTEMAGEPLPDELKRIVDRSVARDARDRYGSARELLAALEAIAPTGSTFALRAATGQTGTQTSAHFSPLWWWEFHQAVSALVYWLMAIPVWAARGAIGGGIGRTVFIVTLVAIIVSANLRLHRWFTSRFYPSELQWARERTSRWVTVADWIFAAALVAAGLLVGDANAALAILLLSFGIGTALVFLFVEPVTERAAFREP